MLHKEVRNSCLFFPLLFQAFAIFIPAQPYTDPVSLLNATKVPTAQKPYGGLISKNVTLPGRLSNRVDYWIVNTPLVLRITETGREFTVSVVDRAIDSAIRKVVAKINTGFGPERIDPETFYYLSGEIDICIKALQDAEFTYYFLGKRP